MNLHRIYTFAVLLRHQIAVNMMETHYRENRSFLTDDTFGCGLGVANSHRSNGRILRAERLDEAEPVEAARNLRDIARINRWFGGHRTLVQVLKGLIRSPLKSAADFAPKHFYLIAFDSSFLRTFVQPDGSIRFEEGQRECRRHFTICG